MERLFFRSNNHLTAAQCRLNTSTHTRKAPVKGQQILTGQSSASLPVALPLLQDEVGVRSLRDPQRSRQQHVLGTDPHDCAFLYLLFRGTWNARGGRWRPSDK